MAEERDPLWLWEHYLRGVADVPVFGSSDIEPDDLIARAIGAMHRREGGALYAPDEIANEVRKTRYRAGLEPEAAAVNREATARHRARWRPAPRAP